MNEPDPTEPIRRTLRTAIAGIPAEDLQANTPTWTTEQLSREFEVLAFRAPLVVVKRKADAQMGSLMFKDHPRIYFAYEADRPQTDP